MSHQRKNLWIVVIVILVLGAFSVSAEAVKPLPQPEFVIFAVEPPTAISPNNAESLIAERVFRWTSVEGAEKYVLKMRVVQTGKKHKVVLNAADITCDASCGWTAAATDDLFKKTKTGQTVKWKVIARFADGSRIKSANQTTQVDEVREPVLNAPGYGFELDIADEFFWLHYPVNASYLLIIADDDTKAVVFEGVINAASCAVNTCSYSAALPWGNLTPGEVYEWHVRAFGATGEKAKSQKRIFSMPVS